MPIEPVRLLPALIGSVLLLGCATDGQTAMGADTTWGEANRQTFAAQVIDPAPQYDYAVPEGNGEHTAKAIERYRLDKVKRPQTTRAGNGAGGNNSGSGNDSGSSNSSD